MKKKRKNTAPRKKEIPAAGFFSWRTRVFGPPGISLALALATLAVFWSVTNHDFVNLDDQVYVTANPRVQAGLTWANFVWAFTNLNAGFWHPLTWLSIMLDCQLFGLRPGGHHLTSLVLHTANTVLLFIVLRQMTAATWRSAFVAALFALHPLHVETVAWAADRKDVLSTLFWLLTMLTYCHYARAIGVQNAKDIDLRQSAGNRRLAWCWYLGTLACFVCAIMSKTMVVTLPLVLVLLDWWPLGRFQLPDRKRIFLDKLPFLAISLVAGLLTIHAESGVGALGGEAGIPLQFRLANALLSCCRYMGQLFWPADLAVFYPYAESFPVLLVAGAALLLVIVSWLVMRYARAAPYLPVGWFWFLVTLLPVIGLIQVGGHARADRYTYVPLIGIFVLVAWGANDFTKSWRKPAFALSAIGAMVLIACAAVTARQLGYWQNSGTLFRHARAVTSKNYIAAYCLGLYVSDHGNSQEAVKYYREALEINPNYGEAYCNLGIETAVAGNLEEAASDFRKAIQFNPRLAGAHSNLGLALEMQRRLADAESEYRASLRLAPEDARVHGNLARVLDDQKKHAEAITEYQEAIKLDPGIAELHANFAATLAEQGRREEAILQYAEALRLKPDYTEAQQELNKLNAAGKPSVR